MRLKRQCHWFEYRLRNWFRALVMLSAVSVSEHSSAIAPPSISDSSLANFPIIVVASWPQAKIQRHDDIQGNVARHIEAFTDLKVDRVVKGDVTTANHRLKISWGISWNADGKFLNSGTSTLVLGDVADVTKPNLWFLVRDRSWESTDKTEYLTLLALRAIQPLALEEYFQVIRSPNPDAGLKNLLASRDEIVLRRTMRFACGEILPWPNDSGYERRYRGPADLTARLPDQIESVARIIDGTDHDDLRPLAVSVYADLAGARGLELVRRLLNDRDVNVRLTVVGVLARSKDKASAPGFAAALHKSGDASLTASVIEALRVWHEVEVVPALIRFLENDEVGALQGKAATSAARARSALHEITGVSFPYDVEKSSHAWNQAKDIADRVERRTALSASCRTRDFWKSQSKRLIVQRLETARLREKRCTPCAACGGDRGSSRR